MRILHRIVVAAGLVISARALAQNSAVEGTSTTQGAIQTTRTNYVDPATTNSAYPQQTPYHFTMYTQGRIGINDTPRAVSVDQINGTGFETFLGRSAGNNNNGGAFQINYRSLSPIQNGGVEQINIQANGTDDVVAHTLNQLCTGNDRGDNEGCEHNRDFVGFNHSVFGGRIGQLSVDSVTPSHRVLIVNNADPNYDLSVVGGGRVLIDITKKFAPSGNIATASMYTDHRFGLLNADPDLAAALGSRFGSKSFEATLVAGADNAKYTGCPATRVAANWGSQAITLDGVSRQVQIDPYNDNPVAGGSKTQAMCLTLSTTAGLAAGEIMGFWGAQNNWELQKITQVVDSNHIVIPLDHPHDVGELVTAGAGVGWGVSTPSNDYPAGYLNDGLSTNKVVQHAAYPIIRINKGAIEVYVNSSSTIGKAELHLNLFTSLAPVSPLSFKPTVRNGVITALNPTSTAGNKAFGNYNTTSGLSINGLFHILPPPTLTVTGCTTAPVITFTAAAEFSYAANLISGGTGCAANTTITTAETATNPVVFYPITRTVHVEDPRKGCNVGFAYVPNCPNDGYLRTDQLTADWAVGDQVEQAPHWNQYVADQLNYSASVDQLRSGQNGSTGFERYRWAQGNEPVHFVLNKTPPNLYFGRAANQFQRTSTTDASQIMDATVATPFWTELSPNWQGAVSMDSPPMAGQGRNGTGGFVFRIECHLPGDMAGYDVPCLRGVLPDFDLFRLHLSTAPGGSDNSFGYSPLHNCFTIGGNCLSTAPPVQSGSATFIISAATGTGTYTTKSTTLLSAPACGGLAINGAPLNLGGVSGTTWTHLGTGQWEAAVSVLVRPPTDTSVTMVCVVGNSL